MLVALPPQYEEKAARGEMYNVLYVLDQGHTLFSHLANQQRALYAETRPKEGRNWYPEVIVVGIQGPAPASPGALLSYLRDSLVPFVDGTYRSKPFAAGRAVCGFDDALGGEAIRALLLEDAHAEDLKNFRFYAVGSAGAHKASARGSSSLQLPDKAAVLLTVGKDEAPARIAAARSLAEETAPRASCEGELTMFVNNKGEQTYSVKDTSGRPPPVELEVLEGGGGDLAFASAAASWVGRRFETQKLESLGSLLPWHEFK